MAESTVIAPTEPQIQDLGALKCEKLFVGLLPSKYSAVIVNYQNDALQYPYIRNAFRVSCVQPPTTHNVQVRKEAVNRDNYNYMADYHKLHIFKHKAPTTLLSISYVDYPSSTNAAMGFIWALDDKSKDRIKGVPYTLPNVSANGDICWGSAGYPADLKSAYSRFWGSNFNHMNIYLGKDVIDEVGSTVEYVKRWKSVVLENAKFQDLTATVCGKKFWSTTKKADGLIVTNKRDLLKQIPKEYWKKDQNQQPFIIALATKGEEVWSFDGGLFKFTLPASSIETIYSKKKKVQAVLKKFGTEVTTTKVVTPKTASAKKTRAKAATAKAATTTPEDTPKKAKTSRKKAEPKKEADTKKAKAKKPAAKKQ